MRSLSMCCKAARTWPRSFDRPWEKRCDTCFLLHEKWLKSKQGPKLCGLEMRLKRFQVWKVFGLFNSCWFWHFLFEFVWLPENKRVNLRSVVRIKKSLKVCMQRSRKTPIKIHQVSRQQVWLQLFTQKDCVLAYKYNVYIYIHTLTVPLTQ